MCEEASGTIRCPSCEEVMEGPYKTWELVALFPDKKMRITVTILGMFKCPLCRESFRRIVSKAKMEVEGIEIRSKIRL